MRIACGGFMHETNTFVPEPTGWDRFTQEGAWPGFTRGSEILTKFRPFNIAIAGFMDVAEKAGHTIVPLSWSFAQPSGKVADSVFERASAYLLADIADTAPDAVFLELHGAMATETIEDAEGELLARVRRLVGPDMTVVASLDLHANVTTKMVDNASFMSAYRTYPHIDWLQTGQRVAQWVDRVTAWGPQPARAFRQIPFLIPIASGCSMIEPMKGLYALLAEIEAETGAHLSLCPGFPSADIFDMGATVIGYGADQKTVGCRRRQADRRGHRAPRRHSSNISPSRRTRRWTSPIKPRRWRDKARDHRRHSGQSGRWRRIDDHRLPQGPDRPQGREHPSWRCSTNRASPPPRTRQARVR